MPRSSTTKCDNPMVDRQSSTGADAVQIVPAVALLWRFTVHVWTSTPNQSR